METGIRKDEVQNSHLPMMSLPTLLPQLLHVLPVTTGLKNLSWL
jgi:hypothetical protein